MNFRFEKAAMTDAQTLARVSERAFNSDVNYGAPKAKGGPYGYNDDRFQTRLMVTAEYYKIVVDDPLRPGGRIIGGIIFRPLAYQHYELIRIFVDPPYQRHGAGAQAMAFMESQHPEVKLWTLGTPKWNTRTPAFYTQCGYVQVGFDKDGILFEKCIETGN